MTLLTLSRLEIFVVTFRQLSEGNESIDLAEIVGRLLVHYFYHGHVAVGRLIDAVKVQDEVVRIN